MSTSQRPLSNVWFLVSANRYRMSDTMLEPQISDLWWPSGISGLILATFEQGPPRIYLVAFYEKSQSRSRWTLKQVKYDQCNDPAQFIVRMRAIDPRLSGFSGFISSATRQRIVKAVLRVNLLRDSRTDHMGWEIALEHRQAFVSRGDARTRGFPCHHTHLRAEWSFRNAVLEDHVLGLLVTRVADKTCWNSLIRLSTLKDSYLQA